MNKKLSLIFLGLIFIINLSGCQSADLVNNQIDQDSDKTSFQKEPMAISSVLGSKIINESGLLSVLAAYNQGNADKYQLHDVKTNGEYARGRFSYNNKLGPEIFWAKLSAGLWSLVFVSDKGPECAKLRDFPVNLKSGCREDLSVKQISNFTDCLKAGFKPTNEQPRRCINDKGNVFLEIVPAGANKRYVSQDAIKCCNLDFNCSGTEKSFLDDVGCGCQAPMKSGRGNLKPLAMVTSFFIVGIGTRKWFFSDH